MLQVDSKRSNLMITKIKSAGERTYYNVARIAILVFVIIVCTATTVLAAENAYVAYVYCDDELIRVVSFSSSPDDILNKANVQVGEDDLVDLNSYREGEDDGVIYVYRACDVTVRDEKKERHVNLSGTVDQAVKKAGFKLEKGDELNYDGDTYVFDSMIIEIDRGFTVKVTVGKKTKQYKATEGTTVKEFLSDNTNIKLGEHDKISKKLTDKLEKGDKIVIKRVTYGTHKATEVLKYKTVTKKDKSLYKGNSKVIQNGKDGKQVVTYKDKYVNGKLVKSTAVDSKIKREATDKIVVVGAKSRPAISVNGRRTISELKPPSKLKLDKNGRPKEYKKLITGKATAYYSGTTCSTGVHVKPGYVAVNPRQIPYGTKMYIVSSDGKWNYGYAVAADTGGFARNGSGTVVDLFMWSEATCWDFGRRNVEIYIL